MKTLMKSSKFPENSLTAVSSIYVVLLHIGRRDRWFKSCIWVISWTQFSTDECKHYFIKTWFLWHVLILMVVYRQNSEDTLNLVHMTCWPRPRCSEHTASPRILILAQLPFSLTPQMRYFIITDILFHSLLQEWQIFIIFFHIPGSLFPL